MTNYWLDTFTDASLKEFRDAGAHTSGGQKDVEILSKRCSPVISSSAM
jgi:hypothetical protein